MASLMIIGFVWNIGITAWLNGDKQELLFSFSIF